MKRFAAYVLLNSLCFSAAHAGLTSQIDALLADKPLAHALVGVEILTLGDTPESTQILYEHNATTPRIPASNLKLTTTATALENLGADFTFKTYLEARGNDIALVGDGDPTLGDAEMLKKLGWGTTTVFKNWADTLKQRGLSEVHDVYVDDSIFDEDFLHPEWPADQAHKRYVAEVGGVNLNANCVDFYLRVGNPGSVVGYRTDPPTQFLSISNTCTAGHENAVWLSRKLDGNNVVLRGETNVSNDEPVSVTVHDPSLFAATVLKETFESSGIKISGEVKRDRTIRATGATTQPAWVPVAVHNTPLPAVLARANKDSMNLYAESLCKRVGAAATGQSGSWENGTKTVSAFLQSCGVKSDEFELHDGCGLSKKDNISPNGLARVLEHEYFSKNRDTFTASLAVAGVDGTFEKRFRNGGLQGRVFGKSGYVVGVSTCSGYLKTRDGKWYVFSIMVNQIGDIASAKQIQERIVQAVDNDGAVATDR